MAAPGTYVDRHLKLVESGCLALAFAGLASKDGLTRAMGYLALSRIHAQLESAKLTAEKKVWLHLIDVVRNGVRAARSKNEETDEEGEKSSSISLRIPSIVSNFLARACQVLRNPLDPMYRAISGFILAKPALDLFSVPEFLRLFHSLDHGSLNADSDVAAPSSAEDHRNWILRVLVDGTRDHLDYEVASKAFVPKLLASFHDSGLAAVSNRVLIRAYLAKLASLPGAAPKLVRSHGVLLWASGAAMMPSPSGDTAAKRELLGIVASAWQAMSEGKKDTPRETSAHFLVTLQAFSGCKDKDCIAQLRALTEEINIKLNQAGVGN